MTTAASPTAGAVPTPAELLERDRWSRDRLLTYQRERLRALLRHAAAASPYYGELLGRDAEDAELADLPTLSKRTLMEEFDRIATDPRLRREAVERHVLGDGAAEPFAGAFRVFGTSGTTGERALIVYSLREFELRVAVTLRSLVRAGITPAMRLAAIGAPHPLHITRQLFAGLRAGRSASPQLSVTTPLDELVAALDEYRPEAIATYPSVAVLLAEAQLEGRLRIAPRILAVGSEVLTEDAERRFADAWGLKAINVYDATESPHIAAGAPEHVGLHVAEDALVLEVVDEAGRPVAPGIPGHRVLLTNLVNRAQPLIRYELSDSVVLAAGEDPTGRPYARIARVDGRSDDVLDLPTGAGGRVRVLPYALREPFAGLPDVRQYQLVLDGDVLHARVVPRPGAAAALLELVHERLVEGLRRSGAEVRVVVEPVEAVEREPGHAAKVKLVKNLG